MLHENSFTLLDDFHTKQKVVEEVSREDKKAIIPAVGYGTRSLPITKVVPKELFPIGVKPAIHYVLEEAMA